MIISLETDADDCCFNIEIICGTIAFADAIEPDSSSIFSNVALYSSLGACAEAEGAAANNIATHWRNFTLLFIRNI